MIFAYLGAMGLCMIPLGIYMYFYLRRLFRFFSKGNVKKWMKPVCILLAALIALSAVNTFSTSALVVLHVAAAAVVMELIKFIVIKTKKQKQPEGIWRSVYQCGLVPVVITAVILVLGYFHMMDVNEKDYVILTEKNIQDEGYLIALISDLHIGNTMNAEKLQSYCDVINEKHPDIVLLAGDIFDEQTKPIEMQAAIAALATIESKYGTYYVFGNHDKARYVSNPPFTEADIKVEMQFNGIAVLEDTAMIINDEITLIGRQDRSSANGVRTGITELVEEVDTDTFLLLMDHQPVGLKENASAGVDLQVSGHTHGGQIWPVGLISDILGFGELNYGYEKIDDFQIVVSSGIAGWGYPIRTGSNSEYVFIQLQKK